MNSIFLSMVFIKVIAERTIVISPFFEEKRSKRKLGGALLCLPYASLRGFYVSSGDTLSGFWPRTKGKQNTWQYSL